MKTTIEQNEFSKQHSFDFRTITSFKKACEYQGLNEDEFFKQNNHEPKDVLAYKMLRIIAYAINGGKILKYCEDYLYEVYLRLKKDENGKIAGIPGVLAHHAPPYTVVVTGSRICFFFIRSCRTRREIFLASFHGSINRRTG